MGSEIIVIPAIFIGLPWIILHYVTQWKRVGSLTAEDENLLDDLHETARRLEERLCSVERIMTAENPEWRSVACDPVQSLESSASVRRIGQ